MTRGRSALLITEPVQPLAAIRSTAEIRLQALADVAHLRGTRETRTLTRVG